MESYVGGIVAVALSDESYLPLCKDLLTYRVDWLRSRIHIEAERIIHSHDCNGVRLTQAGVDIGTANSVLEQVFAARVVNGKIIGPILADRKIIITQALYEYRQYAHIARIV